MFRVLHLQDYLRLIEYDKAKCEECIVLDYVTEEDTTRPRWSKRYGQGNIVQLFTVEVEEFLLGFRALLYGYILEESHYRKLFSEGTYEICYPDQTEEQKETKNENVEPQISPALRRGRGSVVNLREQYEAMEAAVEEVPGAPPAKPHKNFRRVKVEDPALYEPSYPGFYYFDHPFYYDHPSRSGQEDQTEEEILRSTVEELRELSLVNKEHSESDQDQVISDYKQLRQRCGSVSDLASSFETVELANKLEMQIHERPGSSRGYTRDLTSRYDPRYRYYSESELRQNMGIDREEEMFNQETPIETPDELNRQRGSVSKMANSFDSVAHRNKLERTVEFDPRARRELVKYEVDNSFFEYPLYQTRRNKVKDLSLIYQDEGKVGYRPSNTRKQRRHSVNDMRVRFEDVEERDFAGSEDDMEVLRRQNNSLDEMKRRFRSYKEDVEEERHEEKDEEEKEAPGSLYLEETEENTVIPRNSTLSPVMVEKYKKKKNQRSRIKSGSDAKKLTGSHSIERMANDFDRHNDSKENEKDVIRMSDEDSALKRMSSISNIALRWEKGMEVEPASKDPSPISLYSELEEDSSDAERNMKVTDRAKWYVERRESEDKEYEMRMKCAPLLDAPTPEPVPLYNTSEEEEDQIRPTTPQGVPWEESAESFNSPDVMRRRMSVSDIALQYVLNREEEVAAAEELERSEPLPDFPRKRTSVELYNLEDETCTRDTFTDTNLTTEDQGFGSISMPLIDRAAVLEEFPEFERTEENESGNVHSLDSSSSDSRSGSENDAL